MALNVAAGYPQYTGNFIPELWSTKLLLKFYDATVLAAISNTDYEGEIKGAGDKVKIRTVPNVTIRDYVKGQSLTVENLDSDPIELLIDTGKYFAFTLDDVDAAQADLPLLNKWSEDASEQMKIVIDQDVLGNVYADVHAKNKGTAAGVKSGAFNFGTTGTPLKVDKTTVLDLIVDAGTALDEQNIPETDRYMVIPAWMAGLIKKSDLKDASLTGDGKSVLRNGRLGMIDRFTLYSSNNLATVTDTYSCYHVLAGHKYGLTFASQLTKVETLRAESTFGDIVRGLQVYGYKVIKPEAICDLYVYKG